MHIYGHHPVLEALASSREIEKIFIVYGAKDAVFRKIQALAKDRSIACTVMDRRKFQQLERKVCGEATRAQGVIALLPPMQTLGIGELFDRSYEITDTPLLIAIDGITDPHNLGAIARSAECAGAQGLILPQKHSAPLNSIAIKASAGALEHLPVAKTDNLERTLQDAKYAHFDIIGTADNAAEVYTGNHYERAVVLIVGSEGRGMRPAVKKFCDTFVAIPVAGKISSLNVSVAAGVVLFEIRRQRILAEKG